MSAPTATPRRTSGPVPGGRPPTPQDPAGASRLAASRWRLGVVSGLATLGSALAMSPLLDGPWWLPTTLAVVAAVIVTGILVRTLRWPAPLQPVLQVAALVVSVTALFADEVAVGHLLPGPAALTRLQELAVAGRDFASGQVPPAGPDPGLLLLIAAGVGLVALVVDTLAAALDLPGLTIVALGALFVVPWIVGRGTAPGWTFAVVALSWLAILASAQRERVSRWSPHARPSAPAPAVLTGVLAVLVALMVGTLAAPRMPFSDIGLGTGGLGRGTVAIDELVSLRRSLVGSDNRVVLTMSTSQGRPDYLRLAVLEAFDGQDWSKSTESILAPNPPRPAIDRDGVLIDYRIEIGPLAGSVVPAPSGVLSSADGHPVAWEQRTGLLQRADGSSVTGSTAELAVLPSTLDADTLRKASVSPGDISSIAPAETADPSQYVGGELLRLAAEITSGAATPFDAALALQDWFTSSGGFRYSTEVPAGSDEDALSAFLTERVGYCEQFAATMALMARSLGIPARVVVGFTQGSQDDQQWVVRGTDAHAWPELWMGSAGWVRFEPTPGSTAIRPAYTLEQNGQRTPSATPSNSASASAQPRASGVPAGVPDELAGAAAAATGPSGVRMAGRMAGALLLLVLVLPAAVRVVRRRRRAHLGDGESAFAEVTDSALDLGLVAPDVTPARTMDRVTAALAADDDRARAAAARILATVEVQRYGPPDASGRQIRAGALAADARTVRAALTRGAGRRRRLRATFLPRSVLTWSAVRRPGLAR